MAARVDTSYRVIRYRLDPPEPATRGWGTRNRAQLITTVVRREWADGRRTFEFVGHAAKGANASTAKPVLITVEDQYRIAQLCLNAWRGDL